MNISYDLWPIWADYLEEQGQNTELLRYMMIYSNFNTCVRDLYIDVSRYENNSGSGNFYHLIQGNGCSYSFWLSSSPVEYGNCNGVFKLQYYGSGKRDIDPINYQTGNGIYGYFL